MLRFGVEEEFMLVDPHRLVPVSLAGEIRDRLSVREELAPQIGGEFLAAQLEYATTIQTGVAAAGTELLAFRTALGDAARELAVIPLAGGTPFDVDGAAAIVPTERYQHIASEFGEMLVDHQVNGLHVHVEVVDPDARVRALNGTRDWLPFLLAITGDSPFWHGRDTGFESWRNVILRRMPTAGCPPVFDDAADYRRRTQLLVDMGALIDLGSIAWAARLSERFPTVEVRVFDAQLSVDDSVMAAALTRAIVDTSAQGAAGSCAPAELVDAALWEAGRRGADARLPDPLSGTMSTVWALADGLVEWIRPSLEASGDLELVIDGLERIRLEGTGAARQRERHRDSGAIGLRGLYREGCDGRERRAPTPLSMPFAEVAGLMSSPFPPTARQGSVAS
ncbi:YbdK family carboxylate-amine ligase [Agromyces fucosus]|uniref:Putative glutamate--cysteine ligase 2 n=1 Tax=Agromyces fucosus TaxID=41985 RepID=A0A4Q2JKM7_9MICO|nr:YbdK family carboxylate-amine ligase [Agromyces fucosus]RXZ46600.1 YbdK family carboxylate-amine ligase [Agromyces fucosus]